MLLIISALSMLIYLTFSQNWQKSTNLTGMMPYYSVSLTVVPQFRLFPSNFFQLYKH